MFDDIPADHQPQELPLPPIPPMNTGRGKGSKFPSKRLPTVEETPKSPPQLVSSEYSLSETTPEDSAEEFEVNKIYSREIRFDEKRNIDCWFYEVHFVGEPSRKHEWISEYDCAGCQELIDEFLKEKQAGSPAKIKKLEEQLKAAEALLTIKKTTVEQLESIPNRTQDVKDMIKGNRSALTRIERTVAMYKKKIQEEKEQTKDPNRWLTKLQQIKRLADEILSQCK